jgi:hypothetical protein
VPCTEWKACVRMAAPAGPAAGSDRSLAAQTVPVVPVVPVVPLVLLVLSAALLAGCGSKSPGDGSSTPAMPGQAETPATAPTPPSTPTAPGEATGPGVTGPGAGTAEPRAPAAQVLPLGPPEAARNWAQFRRQAALRLMAANPKGTYAGPVPEPLLAIPVLEIELNADGSVRRVQVMRHPRQAKDTTQLAIDAVHRAAPYGSMTRLPRPWKWAEVFLFDDDRKFKPRELDQ